MTNALKNPQWIKDIPDERSRFAHVAKHLYNPKERWDLAVPKLPRNLISRAVERGCDHQNLRHGQPSWFGACDSCRQHVLDDNKNFYQPAYRSALLSAVQAGRHGRSLDAKDMFVGDNGVYVIVKKSRDHGRHVATAYRVEPKGVAPSQAHASDFFLAAERKLRDKTDYSGAPQ